MYFILDGQISSYYRQEENNVKTFRPSDDFGDECLLEGRSHYTFVCDTEVLCMFVSHKSLKKILIKNPKDKIFLTRRAYMRRKHFESVKEPFHLQILERKRQLRRNLHQFSAEIEEGSSVNPFSQLLRAVADVSQNPETNSSGRAQFTSGPLPPRPIDIKNLVGSHMLSTVFRAKQRENSLVNREVSANSLLLNLVKLPGLNTKQNEITEDKQSQKRSLTPVPKPSQMKLELPPSNLSPVGLLSPESAGRRPSRRVSTCQSSLTQNILLGNLLSTVLQMPIESEPDSNFNNLPLSSRIKSYVITEKPKDKGDKKSNKPGKIGQMALAKFGRKDLDGSLVDISSEEERVVL